MAIIFLLCWVASGCADLGQTGSFTDPADAIAESATEERLSAAAQTSPSLAGIVKVDPARKGQYSASSDAESRSALTITRQGRQIQVQPWMRFEMGDEIETGADSVAIIRFPEGHEVTLFPNTRVRLGSVFAYFGELVVRAKGLFSVKTEFLTAGVEGTEFWVKLDRSGNFSLAVLDGRVLLGSIQHRWDSIPVSRNQVFTARRDERPRPGTEAQGALQKIKKMVAEVDKARPLPQTPQPPQTPPPPTCPS